MSANQSKHWQFLEDELIAEAQNFEKKFSMRAQTLLLEKEEMYVGQLVGFRGGEMLVKFPNTRTIPRKREFLYCMLLPAELRLYRNWGDRTYEDLYAQRFKGTELVCVWHSKSDDLRCSLVGFSEVELSFEEFIKDTPGILLVFAPKRPPIEYIANLQKVILDSTGSKIDMPTSEKGSKDGGCPVLIKDEDTCNYIYTKLINKDIVILQGPPGTGKTYVIAQLCRKLALEGKSVLVTALTNRALMEVAGKPALEDLLEAGKVSKTSLTVNERNELPYLREVDDYSPLKGSIILSTYYKSSAYASEMQSDSKFDFVIMDEASQAFTAMFIACLKMGKKNLWVGDTKQMPPIVELSFERIRKNEYSKFINGMEFISAYSNEPIYQLTSTRRFGSRAAWFTGIFYDNTLETKVLTQDIQVPEYLKSYLNPQGGPALIIKHMAVGDLTPVDVISYILNIVRAYLEISPKKKIAILAHQVRTANAIQIALMRAGIDSRDVIADTVARVQGLTTDVAIYLVVNSSYSFSLNPKLFNVATSRAREHTIIIADESAITHGRTDDVNIYLRTLKNDKSERI